MCRQRAFNISRPPTEWLCLLRTAAYLKLSNFTREAAAPDANYRLVSVSCTASNNPATQKLGALIELVLPARLRAGRPRLMSAAPKQGIAT
jgi:hypothetical protein